LKRTFIAIDIPINHTSGKDIEKINNVLKNEKIKWIQPVQYHITLQFLGNIDESYLEPINHSLEKITDSFTGFSLTLKEFGVFKNIRNPRILWLGFTPCAELNNLKISIEDEMIKFGFDKSGSKFLPHLTIGRVKYLKDKEILRDLIEEFREYVFQEIKVREIIFYESILKSKGPEYIVLKRHSLGI
jgi:2'-5' RNA ligase